jgi:hypothetical protein
MSTHTILATIPVGDPDLGAEFEAQITFDYVKGSPDYWNRSIGTWEQGYAAEIDFVKAEPFCNGKPSPFYGAFADLERESFNERCRDWLESDEGYAEALAVVDEDDERGREYAAELRADR